MHTPGHTLEVEFVAVVGHYYLYHPLAIHGIPTYGKFEPNMDEKFTLI